MSVCKALALLVRFSTEDDINNNMINVDFNSFDLDFLIKWFNIVFSDVIITLSRWLSFIESLCFLFESLFINNFRLINVFMNVFNVAVLSSFYFCTAWYKDLCFVTLFILSFSACCLWHWESKTLCMFQHASHFHMFWVCLWKQCFKQWFSIQ